MLTFLRKIRRSLIESGSARKYLLYAIGEILLVMIGILLALQVNNWNEKTRADKTEFDVLGKLTSDLESDRIQFMEIDSFYQNHLEYWIGIKKLFAKEQHDNDDVLIMTEFYNVDLKVINPQTTAYDEMLNSGKIYNISNNDLIEEIIDYYQETDDRVSQILIWKNELFSLMNGLHMTDYWNIIIDENESLKEKREILFQNGKKTQIFNVLKRVSGWSTAAVKRDKGIMLALLDHNKALSDQIQLYLKDK